MARRPTVSKPPPSDARADLLNAAARLFASQGYSATGVQEIADVAGMNKAMLYYYFGSKERIYDLLIAEGIGGLQHAVVQASQPGLPIAERLRAFLTAYLSLVVERPWVAHIIYREVMGYGERARQTVTDHFSESIRQIAQLLADAHSDGALRQVDPTLSAYTLLGMATIFISSFFLTGRPIEVNSSVELIVDLFFHGAACREVQ